MLSNQIYIQSEGYLNEVEASQKKDGSAWVEVYDDYNNVTNLVANAYIYMANLLDVSMVTFYDYTAVGSSAPNCADQNIKISLGYSLKGLVPTTIKKGIYTINRNGDYLIANLAGSWGWIQQVQNQDFERMPAAHWAIEQVNTSSTTSPVEIINREFDEEAFSYFSPRTQFYAVEGSSDTYFYFRGSIKDTITVKAIDATDKKIGYKYLTEDELKVEKYRFDYLHGLVMDKSLAGGEDGLYVDAEEEYLLVSLEDAVRDDIYGYDNLVRNAYYLRVSNSKFKEGSYVAYNENTRKYYVKELEEGHEPQAFFLKENNFVEATQTPYYALLEANIVSAYFYTSDNSVDYYSNASDSPISADYNGLYWVPVYDKDGKQENLRFVIDNNIEFYVYTKKSA
ncbi:MAG: hypothetical protein LUD02_06145 [Tannerellaceae bacterium]|nr:hypothetical protein [Tannerellaceae bacterium]